LNNNGLSYFSTIYSIIQAPKNSDISITIRAMAADSPCKTEGSEPKRKKSRIKWLFLMEKL